MDICPQQKEFRIAARYEKEIFSCQIHLTKKIL